MGRNESVGVGWGAILGSQGQRGVFTFKKSWKARGSILPVFWGSKRAKACLISSARISDMASGGSLREGERGRVNEGVKKGRE